MWEYLAMTMLLAIGGYLTARICLDRTDRRKAFLRQQHAAAALHLQQLQLDGRRRRAARQMQVAIQQLAHSPDFRRAASFVAGAVQAGVPLDFRLRQFRRLRPLLVEQLVHRLQAGATLETASAGLRELVAGLGAAGYEADYVVNDAQDRRRPAAAQPPDYRERLQRLHAAHSERLEAIRNTSDLEEELREQLLEVEQERFRRELLEEPDERR